MTASLSSADIHSGNGSTIRSAVEGASSAASAADGGGAGGGGGGGAAAAARFQAGGSSASGLMGWPVRGSMIDEGSTPLRS